MPDLVNFGKGTASDEQDLISHVENFMVGICGWEKIDTVSDTASDKDLVFKSGGKLPERYQDLYCRWRGYSNYIYNYMYTRWVSSGDYDGEIHDSTYSRSPCSSTGFDWWGFGNEDGVWFVWVSGGSYYSAYTGYTKSYLPESEDMRPIANISQLYDSYWFHETRVYMHNVSSDRVGSISGTEYVYKSDLSIYNDLLSYSAPSDRDGNWGHCPILVCREAGGIQKELRGELMHCLAFPGDGLSSEDWITLSGTDYKYFIQRYSDSETTGFGPVLASSGVAW